MSWRWRLCKHCAYAWPDDLELDECPECGEDWDDDSDLTEDDDDATAELFAGPDG